jgi:hypothetical protein
LANQQNERKSRSGFFTKIADGSGLIATKLSYGHVEMKAADSRIMFLDNGVRSTVETQNALPV